MYKINPLRPKRIVTLVNLLSTIFVDIRDSNNPDTEYVSRNIVLTSHGVKAAKFFEQETLQILEPIRGELVASDS